jgi:hypothetical protein
MMSRRVVSFTAHYEGEQRADTMPRSARTAASLAIIHQNS